MNTTPVRAFHWQARGSSLRCLHRGIPVFADSRDHWTHGVCRLLGLEDAAARTWVERVIGAGVAAHRKPFHRLTNQQRVDALIRGSHLFYEMGERLRVKALKTLRGSGACGHSADTVRASGLAHDGRFMVVGCSHCEHGWLVEAANSGARQSKTVCYDEEYFEGKEQGLGYGEYQAQKGWRMEKSHRHVNQIKRVASFLGVSLPVRPRALDVGAGYGFFRKALEETGWRHDGLEYSAHAAEFCRRQFGFQTFVGTIEDYARVSRRQYDVITMWDVLEHVADPERMLKAAKHLLKARGLCVIRTPSLVALEMDVFGRHYHSLKREHLNFFSPRSLCLFLERAGFVPLHLTTESHLLGGFFDGHLQPVVALQKGSDIFAVAGRTDTCVR